MAGMSRKEIARLLDHIEPQGVRTTRTTKGVLLRFPDGQTTAMLHFTGSDVREAKNVRATLKRHGITWPGDQEAPLPDYITSGTVQQRTLARVQAVLEGYEQRYITGGQLNRLLAAAGSAHMNSMTTQRALYQLGWIPTGKSTARKWMRPLEMEPEPVEAQPENVTQLATGGAVSAEPEQEAVELRPAAHSAAAERLEHTAPALQLVPDAATLAAHPAGREFIDTADSWTAKPDELPDGMTVAQLLQVMRAFGLDGEFRVWRMDA